MRYIDAGFIPFDGVQGVASQDGSRRGDVEEHTVGERHVLQGKCNPTGGLIQINSIVDELKGRCSNFRVHSADDKALGLPNSYSG